MIDEVTVHDLLVHQEPVAASPARFKIIRAGRRWGKDKFAHHAILLGHGPVVDGRPRFPGLIHGYDIVWMAPTIPQATAMWVNDVEPRYRHRERVAVNKVEKTVSLLNEDGSVYATLWVRSAEASDGARGMGDKTGGVYINEAAHMDLEYAWRSILRPVLMDNEGFAVIMSTTNAGPDGNIDPNTASKRTPSFFNILCDEVQSGRRGPDWQHFYGTGRDNPRIKPAEFDALVAEYPSLDDPTCQQEVFANLITSGAGVAFPEWDDNVHIARVEAGPRWRAACGGDWGYVRMGWLGLLFTGPERSILRHEYSWKETKPYTVGFNWGIQCLGFYSRGFPLPEWCAVDTPAVSDGGPTILDELQRGYRDALKQHIADFDTLNISTAFINPPKGPGSRETKKVALHGLFKYSRVPGDDGALTVPEWARPELLVHPDCTDFIRTIAKLPRDPKRKDDVDTSALDDPYDGVTAWAMARIPAVERDRIANRSTDQHPGFEIRGGKVQEKAQESYWRDIMQPDERNGLNGPRWQRMPEQVGR